MSAPTARVPWLLLLVDAYPGGHRCSGDVGRGRCSERDTETRLCCRCCCWRPVSAQVPLERARVREAQTTHGASVRFLAGVRAQVRAQVGGHGERALADRAAPRPLAEVHGTLVSPQPGRGGEARGALAAGSRPLAVVRAPHVRLEPAERAEGARTVGAGVRLRARVDARVDREQRRVLEAPAAVGADVRRGVRVCALVVGARAALREALAAARLDAARVRTSAAVRARVSGQRRRRAEPAPALAAHRRPTPVLRRGGGGGDVSVGVDAALVHGEQRRERELVATHGADVAARRRLVRTTTGGVRLTGV